MGAVGPCLLAYGGQQRSRLDRLAPAPLASGRQRAGIAGGGSDAHSGSSTARMLRRNRNGPGNLRRRGGDVVVVWTEYWIFVLQEVEAGEGEIALAFDLTSG